MHNIGEGKVNSTYFSKVPAIMRNKYQKVEALLFKLLSLLTSVFNESEVKEVQHFIDVGEYGLALETLVGIVDEEDKRISIETSKLIYELVGLMSMDKEVIKEMLLGHVTDN